MIFRGHRLFCPLNGVGPVKSEETGPRSRWRLKKRSENELEKTLLNRAMPKDVPFLLFLRRRLCRVQRASPLPGGLGAGGPQVVNAFAFPDGHLIEPPF